MSRYNFTTKKYGPMPHQHMLVGIPKDGAAPTSRYAYVYVPGGGWGLRDPAPIITSELPAGTPYSARTTLMGGAFDNDAVPSMRDSATLFVLNVASESQNSPAGWPTASSEYYNTYTDPIFTTAGLVYDDTGATSYEMGQYIPQLGGAGHVCIKDHTGGVGNGPGNTDYWKLLSEADCLPGRRPGGESAPGGALQSARDVQRAISHIRKNADEYDISPSKVLLEGSSAGAQAAGMAAYSDPLPFGHDEQGTAASFDSPIEDCRPNGVILQIAAFRQDEYATVNKSSAAQSLFLSFMNSLYGRKDLTAQTVWANVPESQKKALDPARAVKSSGYFVPTYLQYVTDGGMFDCWTRDDIANGVETADYSLWDGNNTDYFTGDKVVNGSGEYFVCIQDHTQGTVTEPSGISADTTHWASARLHGADTNGEYGIQIHHSQNGRGFAKLFTDAISVGGLGLETGSGADWRLSLKAFVNNAIGSYGDDTKIYVYNDAPDPATYGNDPSVGRETILTQAPGTSDDKKVTEANYILNTFFTTSRLNKYV